MKLVFLSLILSIFPVLSDNASAAEGMAPRERQLSGPGIVLDPSPTPVQKPATASDHDFETLAAILGNLAAISFVFVSIVWLYMRWKDRFIIRINQAKLVISSALTSIPNMTFQQMAVVLSISLVILISLLSISVVIGIAIKVIRLAE
jgi:hypothetical protein